MDAPSGGAECPPAAGPVAASQHVTAAALLRLPRGLRERPELGPLQFAVLEREDQLGQLSDEALVLGRRGYYQTLARSVAIRETLSLILDEAARVGAEVLPLKGALLAFTVYPDPGMRPMADVDVLVSPARLPDLAAALEAHGYAPYGAGRRRYHLDHHHHLALFKKGAPPIELHARLFHELGLDGDAAPLFARARAVTTTPHGGARSVPATMPPALVTLPAPAWDDHALYVALHAATHGYADSPLWLFDLAWLAPLLAPGSLAVICRDAAARHGVAALHFAFAIAQRYLPALPLFAPPPTGDALRSALVSSLLGASDPLAKKPDRARARLLRLVLTDRPTDALSSLASKLRLRATEALFETPPPPPPSAS